MTASPRAPETDGGAGPDLRPAARRLLRANWREGVSRDGVRYGYTRPDPIKYPDQFLWDSCFHAMAWCHVDPTRARRELRTLLAAQRPSGLVGHTVFWGAPVRLARLPGYNVIGRDDRSTRSIQPPLIAWAWARVAERSPDDPGFAAEGVAPLLALQSWLERERADEDGLLGILQPDESGLDATPAYDRALGWRAHPWPGFLWLVHANRRRGYRYWRAVADRAFTARDVLVNTGWALAWEGLARLGVAGADARAREVTLALVRRLWDPGRGIFLHRGPDDRPIPVEAWAGLAPLALRHLPEEVGRRLVEDHVLHPGRFWLEYPVPSVSAAEPSFRPGDTGWPIRRYWRGPSWPFTPPFVLPGLIRLGYADAARELVARVSRMVAREGFREYHNPRTGQGLGALAFSCSAIVVDLQAQLREAGPAGQRDGQVSPARST